MHEGRHYKKPTPAITAHQSLLDAYLTDFWTYYRRLRTYQSVPTPALADLIGMRADQTARTLPAAA